MMAAFLVFVTVRGELPAYLNVLFGPVPAAGATTQAPNTVVAAPGTNAQGQTVPGMSTGTVTTNPLPLSLPFGM